MNQDRSDQLSLYYQAKDILPTYARFSKKESLDKYNLFRYKFFLEKLYLPPQMFKGASLVEFGPDSGENSLVFADWGANLTLVEPNPNAWPRIMDNFQTFGLSQKLNFLAKAGLQDFKTKEKFRFIDAEGFIYTFRPQSIWIELFRKILADDGFFIISYGEASGELLELFMKTIYWQAKRITGLDSNDIAGRLFRAKWDVIGHTRSFESWAMDVLENPFVRLKYYFDAGRLCQKLFEAGFSLYSSWPNYRDGLDIYWHKKDVPAADKLAKDLKFIARSVLSFAFGRKLFLSTEDNKVLEEVNMILRELLVLFNQLIDTFDVDTVKKSFDHLAKLKDYLRQDIVLADSPQDKEAVIQLIESICKIFEILLKADISALASFCNSDPAFINFWGQPCHYAVFRKDV